MIDLHRKDVAEEEIRAFLGYGQILYPDEMKLEASEILKSSIKTMEEVLNNEKYDC